MLNHENPFVRTLGGVDEGGSGTLDPELNSPLAIDEFHTRLAAVADRMSLDTDLTQPPTYPYVGEINGDYGDVPSNL